MKIHIQVEFIIIVCLILIILYGHLFFSCAKTHDPYKLIEGFKEGVKSAADKIQVSSHTKTDKNNNKLKPSKTVEGFSNGSSHSNVDDIPLMFRDTPFKPDCCPNTYSNSNGCACMSLSQLNTLRNRGGNNVPYSEY